VIRAEDVVPVQGRGLEIISKPEWGSLCTQQPNVLLEGSKESTEAVVLFLTPYLRRPVLLKPPHGPFALPPDQCGALVLQNVAAMRPGEQSELLRWLDASRDRKQVVSTSWRPLFPMVGHGLFDEALYYRLNVVLLCVDSSRRDADTAPEQRAARIQQLRASSQRSDP